jgi:hypothetical protein
MNPKNPNTRKHNVESEIATTSKKMRWAGYVMSAPPVLLLLMAAGMNLTRNPQAIEGMTKYGYPDIALPLGIVALACAVLYAVPQTAVLGAILMTGYLGGATATHVRAAEPFAMAVIVGVLVWGGLYLRDARIRALIPFRKLK